MDALLLEAGERFVQGWRRRAIIDRAVSSLLDRVAPDGLRYQCLGGIEFAQEALHVVDIDDAFLAVLGHAVAARTAREVGALGRMGRGQRAIGDGVAIDIEIAPEQLAVLKLLRGDDLAAVIFARVVPGERLAEPVVHPYV